MTTDPPGDLRGRRLRRAAMAVLLEAGRPLTVGQILSAVERLHGPVPGPLPHKLMADALGWEVQRGWAVRVARGTYAVGTISPTSRWRLLNQAV